VHWRRIASDGTETFPLGRDARGQLIYTADGRMSVVMTAANRAPLDGGDPLGGDAEERADAYSTCLAYAGTYERQDETVAHSIEQSLYPNWSGTVQSRRITDRDGRLVLRTPPQSGPDADVNEIVWARPGTAPTSASADAESHGPA
jgi:Lipocalin-like domain